MEKKKVPATLKRLYASFTNNIEKSLTWYDYELVEIKIRDVKIGIGINKDFSAIKLFLVDDAAYPEGDFRRYRPTYRISVTAFEEVDSTIGDRAVWSISLASDELCASARDFSRISDHMTIAAEIVWSISEEEATRLAPY